MGGTLTEQCRVNEDDLRIVKFCYWERKIWRGNALYLTVPDEKAPANYVPAAAVIHRGRALSGIIGRKGYVGGPASLI